jgi:putative DNA primase/helicase
VDDWREGLALCAVGGHVFDWHDVDPRHGGDASAAGLSELPTVCGKVRTCSGGWHDLIACLGIGKHTNWRPGLDLQGGKPDGTGRGFAFLPPTVRPSKADGVARRYIWEKTPEAPADADDSGRALAALILAEVAAKGNGHGNGQVSGTDWTNPDVGSLVRSGVPDGENQHAKLRDLIWKLCCAGLDDDAIGAVWRTTVGKTALGRKGEPWLEQHLAADLRSARAKLDTEQQDETPEGTIPAYFGTDDANAELLTNWYGEDMIWSKGLGWQVYDGTRYQANEIRALGYGRKVARRLFSKALAERDSGKREQLHALARRFGSRATISSALDLARTELAVDVADLDADPWSYNVANGTISLKTSKLRAHDRGDLITRLAPVKYDPDATHPAWDQFIAEATHCGECAAFLRRAAGYTLVGRTGKNGVFVVHGPSTRGKSTFVGALQNMMGDYGDSVRIEALTEVGRPGTGHNDDIASLRGRRMVAAAEASETDRLREGLVKTLSGGDAIRASFKGVSGFVFSPVLSLWMPTNHVPKMRGDDTGLRARVYRIRFMNKVDERVKALARSEECRAAVLAWAVRGCLEWQQGWRTGADDGHDGLRPPACVLEANAEMWEGMDDFGRFADDCLEFGPDEVATTAEITTAYDHWADAEGMPPGRFRITPKSRAARLEERGCKIIKNTHGVRGRGWLGVGVVTESGSGWRRPR